MAPTSMGQEGWSLWAHGRCRGLKVVKSCSYGALPICLFGQFWVGCSQPQCTLHSVTDRQTDRRQYHVNGRSYCVQQHKKSDTCRSTAVNVFDCRLWRLKTKQCYCRMYLSYLNLLWLSLLVRMDVY